MCIIIVNIKYMIDIAIFFYMCCSKTINNNSSTIHVEWCAICKKFPFFSTIFFLLLLFFALPQQFRNISFSLIPTSSFRRVPSLLSHSQQFFFLLILLEGWRRGLYRLLVVLVVKNARGRKKNKWEKKFQPHIEAKKMLVHPSNQ